MIYSAARITPFKYNQRQENGRQKWHRKREPMWGPPSHAMPCCCRLVLPNETSPPCKCPLYEPNEWYGALLNNVWLDAKKATGKFSGKPLVEALCVKVSLLLDMNENAARWIKTSSPKKRYSVVVTIHQPTLFVETQWTCWDQKSDCVPPSKGSLPLLWRTLSFVKPYGSACSLPLVSQVMAFQYYLAAAFLAVWKPTGKCLTW